MLTAESVTATTATLKLGKPHGRMVVQAHRAGCGKLARRARRTSPTTWTGLIPGTEYTYKAYDVDDCGDTHESASVDFTTGGVSVSNLAKNKTGSCVVGYAGIAE